MGRGSGFVNWPEPRYQSTSSRHSSIKLAMIAGPRKRPSRPQVSTPPRIPSSTHRNGSLVAPPISTGRTTWPATASTKQPKASTHTADATAPWASSRSAATTNTRCAERDDCGHSGEHPQQHRVRYSGQPVSDAENQPLAQPDQDEADERA